DWQGHEASRPPACLLFVKRPPRRLHFPPRSNAKPAEKRRVCQQSEPPGTPGGFFAFRSVPDVSAGAGAEDMFPDRAAQEFVKDDEIGDDQSEEQQRRSAGQLEALFGEPAEEIGDK